MSPITLKTTTVILAGSVLIGCIDESDDTDAIAVNHTPCGPDHAAVFSAPTLSPEYITALKVTDYVDDNTVELIENDSITVRGALATTASDYSLISRENHLFHLGRYQIDTLQKYYVSALNSNSGLYQTDNKLGFSLRDAGQSESTNPYKIGFINDFTAVIPSYEKNIAWLVNLNAQQESDFKICELDLSEYSTSEVKNAGTPEENTTSYPPKMFSVNVNENYAAISMQRLNGYTAVESPYVAIFDLSTWEEIDTNPAAEGLKGLELSQKNPQHVAQNSDDIFIGSYRYNGEYGCGGGGIEKVDLENLTVTTVDDSTCYQSLTITENGNLYAVDNHSVAFGDTGSNTLYQITDSNKTAVTNFENILIQTIAAHGNDLWYSLPQETNDEGIETVAAKVGRIDATLNSEVGNTVNPTLTAREIAFIEK